MIVVQAQEVAAHFLQSRSSSLALTSQTKATTTKLRVPRCAKKASSQIDNPNLRGHKISSKVICKSKEFPGSFAGKASVGQAAPSTRRPGSRGVGLTNDFSERHHDESISCSSSKERLVEKQDSENGVGENKGARSLRPWPNNGGQRDLGCSTGRGLERMKKESFREEVTLECLKIRKPGESQGGLTGLQGHGRLPSTGQSRRKARSIFLLDVMPLCYNGSRPAPASFVKWMRLLLSEAAGDSPIVAVLDGERGNSFRRQLLPRYKAGRRRFHPRAPAKAPAYRRDADIHRALPHIARFLRHCDIPLVRVDDAEADDVVATLQEQALVQGLRVVIASPDMDFCQLIQENVTLCLPLPDLRRWSFYSLSHFQQQHGCHPDLHLGLRALLGDASDNIPGLAEMVPGFGRKTAMKLMTSFGGSLEALLQAAAVRTVGKPYVQSAITEHANLLRTNLQVLSLRRDVPNVILEENWWSIRDTMNDDQAFSILEEDVTHMLRSNSVRSSDYVSHKHVNDVFKGKAMGSL